MTENVLLWKQVNRVQIKYFTTLGWWQTSRNDQHGVGKKKTYIWRIYRSSYFMVMVAVMMAWVGSVLYVPVTSIYPVEKGWRQPDSKTANQMSCDNCKVGTQRPGWNRSGRKAFPQKNRSSTQNQRVSLGGGKANIFGVQQEITLWDKWSNPSAVFVTSKASGLSAAPWSGHISGMLLTGKSSREQRKWSEG